MFSNIEVNKIYNNIETFITFRKGIHDVYVDDTQILQYKLAEIDSKCTIKFSGSEFGENFYAFGLPSKSIWLEVGICLVNFQTDNNYDTATNPKFLIFEKTTACSYKIIKILWKRCSKIV